MVRITQTIADIGGFPQKGVNKSTQILVVGQQDYRLVGEDGMSSKQEKAMALKDAGQDIEIMSEEQFLSMLGVELHDKETQLVRTKTDSMSVEISIDIEGFLRKL